MPRPTSIRAPAPDAPAEQDRIAALMRCDVLDAPRDPDLDQLAELAADICGSRMAAISFIDAERQRLTSVFGFEAAADIAREAGLCDHVLRGGALMTPNAAADARFRDLPAVAGAPSIRFYAGVPLTTRSGYRIGVVCVADAKPRPTFSRAAQGRLERVADLIMARVAARRRDRVRLDAAGFAQSTRSALITTDGSGIITFANPACERMLGYDPGELVGCSVSSIVPFRMRAPHETGMAALAAGGPPRLAGKSVEVTALRRDGTEVPVELSLSSWAAPSGMSIGATMRDISERRERDARLLRLAHQDCRTGLPNRTRLADEIDAVCSASRPAALLAIAVEGLRAVADGFGSHIADAVVEALVIRLTGRLPSDVMLARLGEDEFAVLVPAAVADPELAEQASAAVLCCFVDPYPLGGHVLHIGARIGGALVPAHGHDAAEILASADLALDRTRQTGAARFRLFGPEMRDADNARRALQDALVRAMENGEIELHYQPKVDLVSGVLCGAEALIRWRHPERGLLPPSEFLPAVESSTLAHRFGWWTIDEACRQAAEWRAAGLPPMTVAVNLFAAQVRAGTLADVVAEALKRHALPPEALELEITEVIALLDDAATLGTLARLHESGVRIALDDFGTGYASLSTLKTIPLSTLKIDRSFVRHIRENAHDAAIVRAVLDIGRSLGLAVVAEGIETEDQEAELLAMGCRIGQGYRYGKAMPANEFGTRLRQSFGSRQLVAAE